MALAKVLEYKQSSQGGEDERARASMMVEETGDVPLEDAYLEDAASGLREVLRLARTLVGISDEAELLDLINTTAREKLGCNVCAIAMRADDGSFRYSATSGLSAKEDRALRRRVLDWSGFEALREAAVAVGAVWSIPPGHPVRGRPDVIAGLLPARTSGRRSRESASACLAPLVGADGRAARAACIRLTRSRRLPTSREALLLETLAELTVVGLEIVRARVLEHAAVVVAEAQRRQLEDLLAASAQVRGYYSLDEVLERDREGDDDRRRLRAGGDLPADARGRHSKSGATFGLSEAESEQLRATPVTLKEFAPVMQPEMLVSRSYLFDHRRFQMPQELNEKLNTPAVDREWTDGQWHPEDMSDGADHRCRRRAARSHLCRRASERPLARPGPCSGHRVLRRPVRCGGCPRPPLRAGAGRGFVRPVDRAREPARPRRRRRACDRPRHGATPPCARCCSSTSTISRTSTTRSVTQWATRYCNASGELFVTGSVGATS